MNLFYLLFFLKKFIETSSAYAFYLRLVIVMDYLTLGLLFIIYRKPYSCKKKLSYRSNDTPTNGFFLFIFTPMYWYIAVSKFATYKLITYIKMIRLSAPIYHNFYYFLQNDLCFNYYLCCSFLCFFFSINFVLSVIAIL